VSTIFDRPVVGVAVVVIGGFVMFAPSIVARRRGIEAFPSVSALNAFTFLLLVCTLVSPLFLYGAGSVWLVIMSWSVAGRRRDA
jgi:hypothetical protein